MKNSRKCSDKDCDYYMLRRRHKPQNIDFLAFRVETFTRLFFKRNFVNKYDASSEMMIRF